MAALDMWFKEDLRHLLEGLALNTREMGISRSRTEIQAFQEGYYKALWSVAVALGIHELPDPFQVARPPVHHEISIRSGQRLLPGR